MNIRDLKPGSYEVVPDGPEMPGRAPLNVRDLQPGQYEVVEDAPIAVGKRVYDSPVGPKQAGLIDRVNEFGQSGLLGKLSKEFPTKVVAIAPPISMLPQGAIGQFLTKTPLGRIAMGTGQGAVPNIFEEGKEDTGGLEGAARGAAISTALEAIPATGKLLAPLARKTLPKIGEALSGVNAKNILGYFDETDEANRLIEGSAGDISAAADKIRSELQSALRTKKSSLAGQVGAGLSEAGDQLKNVAPIIERLQTAKSRLNPALAGEEISQIDDLIASVQTASQEGRAGPSLMNEIKAFLQDRAKSSYLKGGQVFQTKAGSSGAAKGAAAEARKLVNAMAPKAGQANKALEVLHKLEKVTPKGLISPDTPHAGLLSAGAGINDRNARLLNTLGKMADYPATEKVKALAAAEAFKDAGLMPKDMTGKAAARLAAAAGVGGWLGGPVGIALASVATSPATVKFAINRINDLRKVMSDDEIAKIIANYPKLIQPEPKATENEQ